MNIGLENKRKSYNKNSLLEEQLNKKPLMLFKEWFHDADENESISEANAMTLSTIGLDGFPKSRVVLLKRFNEEGFIFYTNYNSEKGKALEENNKACISFFWTALERQVIIKGEISKIAPNLSDDYFDVRPRGSQIGAWASNQSSVVKDRGYLEAQINYFEAEFKEITIPRPKYWGGYILKPVSIEFWQGRPNRMHDRILFLLDKTDWKINRLAP